MSLVGDYYNSKHAVQSYNNRYNGPRGLYFYEIETKSIIEPLEDLIDGAVVVDLGMGAGRLISVLSNRVSLYIGLEYSSALIDKAVQNQRNITSKKNTVFINCDARKLPLMNNSVDCVVALGLFEDTSLFDEVVSEASRILKSGGMFVFTAYNINSFFHVRLTAGSYCKGVLSENEISETAKRAGLSLVSCKTIFHIPNRYVWFGYRQISKLNINVLVRLFIRSFILIQTLMASVGFLKKCGTQFVVTLQKKGI